VGELIKELSKYPPDYIVYVGGYQEEQPHLVIAKSHDDFGKTIEIK